MYYTRYQTLVNKRIELNKSKQTKQPYFKKNELFADVLDKKRYSNVFDLKSFG